MGINLKKILHEHRLWIENTGGMRADLQGKNLRDADLQGANLQGANLQGANLQYANLQGAILRYANLQGAILRYANLLDAKLQGVDLQFADLQFADLRGANLRFANLHHTILGYTKGILFLGGFDPRRYVLVAWVKDNKIYFHAGICHLSKSKEECIAHWSSDKYPNKKRGQAYVKAIELLSALINDTYIEKPAA